ncbi:MAG: asparaginase [Ruminococcus sp.]|nr:asparaginase [Ruminococcus sp.]
MKVLVIATGGTIGSVFNGTAIDVDASQSCAVAEMYKTEYSDFDYDSIAPLNLLSEQLSAADLNTLGKVLLTVDIALYDGVILTCGSDNLGYLAAFVGLLTCRREKPLAIVATNLILTDPAANGYANFCAAVKLIARGERGCYVPYRNMDGVMYIHSAVDLRQADLSDDFFSFDGAYAVMENYEIIPKTNYKQQIIPDVFDGEHLPQISDNVMLIAPYPLIDYDAFDFSGKRAVLHTLYHSATLDSAGAIKMMERLSDTPLYLASFRSGRKRYQTAVDAIDAGAIPLVDISPECAYMKLLLACSQDRLTVREFMEG